MAVRLQMIDLRARMYVPPSEVPEPPPPDVADDDVIGAAFLIGYMGSDGVKSEREIIVRSVTQAANGLCVGAFCLMRKQVRAFRAERILMLVNARTGELIEDPVSFFATLAPPPSARPKATPQLPEAPMRPAPPPKPVKLSREQRDQLREAVRPAAIALMYVARADHELSDAEAQIIADLLRDGRSHLGLPDVVDESLYQEMTALTPSGNLLTRAMRAVSRGGFPDDLPRRLTLMARADGRTVPEEEASFREVIATLRRVVE